MNDIVVPFLLVHGEHDLIDLCSDGRVVAVSPIEEGVGT
jgi:hypothetical protein